MSDPTIDDLRVTPGSGWSGVCDVCDQPDVENLCGGCRVGLHYRCGKEHRRTCAALAARFLTLHARPAIEALDVERELMTDEPPAPDLDPEDTP